MINDNTLPLFHWNQFVAGTPSRYASGQALDNGEIFSLTCSQSPLWEQTCNPKMGFGSSREFCCDPRFDLIINDI